MKVVYGNKNEAYKVKEGEIFAYENQLYMKINTIDFVLDINEGKDDLKLGNAVNVQTGEINYISGEVAVWDDAKLVL